MEINCLNFDDLSNACESETRHVLGNIGPKKFCRVL